MCCVDVQSCCLGICSKKPAAGGDSTAAPDDAPAPRARTSAGHGRDHDRAIDSDEDVDGDLAKPAAQLARPPSPAIVSYSSDSDFDADIDAVKQVYTKRQDLYEHPEDRGDDGFLELKSSEEVKDDVDDGTPIGSSVVGPASSGMAFTAASAVKSHHRRYRPRELLPLLIKVMLQALNPDTGVPERVKSDAPCDVTSKSFLVRTVARASLGPTRA